MHKPELVLPAGDLEKLKTALLFGADAVYAGGKDYSLRAYAGNLNLTELATAVQYTHERGKKIYITVNILAHNRDLGNLPAYLETLEQHQIDGIIISDPGVLRLAGKYAPSVPVTVSTQANVSNLEAALFFQDLGVKRIVLARELNLEEIAAIKNRVAVELEMFIHGAMCVSYSGRCLLSHYMTGRSANQGQCAHPCRYRYALMEEKRPGQYFNLEEDERGSYILNSRDLCLLEYIPKLMRAGVAAFKVEGRMKSPLYVASVAAAYREAIDEFGLTGREYSAAHLQRWLQELTGTATRPFTSGFIEGESPLIQDIDKEEIMDRTEFCGIIRGYDNERQMLIIEQRANFGLGDNLQIMIPGGGTITLESYQLYDEEMQMIDRARHARQTVLIPDHRSLPEYSILRRVGASHKH